MTLKEYAQEKIFGPLGMMHSHFHDDHNHIVPNRRDRIRADRRRLPDLGH